MLVRSGTTHLNVSVWESKIVLFLQVWTSHRLQGPRTGIWRWTERVSQLDLWNSGWKWHSWVCLHQASGILYTQSDWKVPGNSSWRVQQSLPAALHLLWRLPFRLLWELSLWNELHCTVRPLLSLLLDTFGLPLSQCINSSLALVLLSGLRTILEERYTMEEECYC